MAGNRPRLLILVGPKGSGKTTLGASLSEVFPVLFLSLEPKAEENARKSGSLAKDINEHNSQHVLSQLTEASKRCSVLVIESTGAELVSELEKYKRLFDVSLVRVRAPLEVCLARARIRDKTAGEEVNASSQAAQSLQAEWALTFENLDPLPSKAQIRNAFAPLFSSNSSTSSNSSSSFPSSSSSSSSSAASSTCPPAIVHTAHAPVSLGTAQKKQGSKKVRSCLKKKAEEPRRGIQWDEPNLQQNEDEKVPRMKIDEPKTPFNYIDADDASGSHTPTFDFQSTSDGDEAMGAHHERRGSYGESKGQGLAAVDVESLASEALRRREEEWEDSEEGSDEFMTFKERKLEQQRQSDFEEKRKQHYNMGSLLKRQKSPVDDEEEPEQN